MNASKENAKLAMEALTRLEASLHPNDRYANEADIKNLAAFLEVANKKLPGEEAYVKERGRRKKTSV